MARAKKRSIPKHEEAVLEVEQEEKEEELEEVEEAAEDTKKKPAKKKAASGSKKKKKDAEDEPDESEEDAQEASEEDSDDGTTEESPEPDEDDAEDTDEEDDADEESDDSDEDDADEEMDSAELEEMPMEMDTDITSIYDIDDEGEDIDMTTMDQGPGRWRKWIIGFFVVIILGLVGYLATLFYSDTFTPTEGGSVELTMEVDEKVASGDVVTIEVTYTNKKQAALEASEIEFVFPDGFQYHTATPEPVDDQFRVWDLEELKSGVGGKIKITGQILGEKDDVKDISALWSYSPTNFSQLFQESADASVLITSSVLETEVTAPEQASEGEEVTYALTFTNTSSVPLERVRAGITYPEGFEFVEATQDTTNPDDEQNEWEWDALQPQEQQIIEVQGIIHGESGDEQSFVAEIGVLEIDGSFNKQIERTSEFVIVNPELELTIAAPEVVTAGEEVELTVTVTNTSELAVKDLDVVLALDGSLFEDSTKEFETIEKLKAGAKKEFTYTTELGEFSESASTLKAVASIAAATVNGGAVTFDNTATAEMKVKGNVVFTAEGWYYDEDLTKVGSGPLPPQVNSETTYVIRWTVNNSSNALSDVTVKTVLPEGMIWPDESSDGVEYDSETRMVKYTQKSLAFGETVVVEFDVTASPIAEDLNKLLPLTGEVTLTATDAVTGDQVTDSASRITTDLPNDEGAAGKGVVEA